MDRLDSTRTPPTDRYEPPTLVDLGTLGELTRGIFQNIPDVNRFGRGSPVSP